MADMICHKVYELLMSILNGSYKDYVLGCEKCFIYNRVNRKTLTVVSIYITFILLSVHFSCLELPKKIEQVVRSYPWQCNDCKSCEVCKSDKFEVEKYVETK
jgi:hypothetical protein